MHRLVPHFILENYQAENYHGSFQAVGMLVDVTGFSQMTDVLARHGLHGSEVLATGRIAAHLLEVEAQVGHLVPVQDDLVTLDGNHFSGVLIHKVFRPLLQHPCSQFPADDFFSVFIIDLNLLNQLEKI